MLRFKKRNQFLIIPVFLFLLTNTIFSQGVLNEVYPNLPRVSYFGVHFLNIDTGFVVGKQGIILKTTNGGKKWVQKPSTVTNDLYRIQSFSDDKIFICGLNGTLLKSTDIGETWDFVNLNISNNFLAFDVIDQQTGWLCGSDSVLYKTEDGGNTWVRKITGYIGDYRDIDFYNSSIGYICGTYWFLVTTDSGESWTAKIYGGFNTVEPVTDQIVITGAPTGGIYYSSDQGTNWTLANTIFTSNIESLAMSNDSIGYASCYSAGHYATTDGGHTWTWGIERLGDYQITFVNDTLGYGTGIDLTLTKTTNGGNTWNRLIINENIHSVYFLNAFKGFLCADIYDGFERSGQLYSTFDGGNSWNKVENFQYFQSYNNSNKAVEFADSLIGFVGTTAGIIYKTTDGGDSWRVNDTALIIIGIEDASVTDFYFYNEYGWALISGSSGSRIKKTTDLGLSWNLMPVEFTTSLYSIFFLDNLKGWVVGQSFVGKTTDGGLTWLDITPPDYTQFYDIYFSDINNGLLTVNTNKTLRTTDGGLTWSDIYIKGRKFLIVDPDNIYLSSSQSLYFSTDKGVTWNMRLDSSNAKLLSTIPIVNNGWGFDYNSAKVYKYEDTLYTPVELTSFNAKYLDNNVLLNWSTSTEVNNKGFEIERKTSSDDFEKVGFIGGSGTTTLNHSYSYVDKNVPYGILKYRLKQIDFNGSFEYSKEAAVSLPVSSTFSLEQNYPNPFNLTTRINFNLVVNSKVTLKIFDILGREISTIINKDMNNGYYKVNFNAAGYPSGVYFYRLIAIGTNGKIFNSIKKLIIIK